MNPTDLPGLIRRLVRIQTRHASVSETVADVLPVLGFLADLNDEITVPRKVQRQDAQLKRFAYLESSMRDYDAGKRRDIVCSRMGIGRSTYYKLRAIWKAQSTPVHENADSARTSAGSNDSTEERFEATEPNREQAA